MQGGNVVANMAKHDNNQPTLCAVFMHAVRKSIKDDEITNTVRKGRMLVAVLTVK